MKKLIVLSAFIFVVSTSYAQDYDRTGFVGDVSSALMIVANEAAETEEEMVESTMIKFDSKNITIGTEVYSIVSKEFDGIDLNTFLVSKRGSNYTLTYIVDDFIAISDNSKPDLVTYYMELTE